MNFSNLILVEPKTRQGVRKTKNKKHIRPLQKWAALQPDQTFSTDPFVKKRSV